MPRKRQDDVKRGGVGWWWLALPLIGVAAYAAFDATLGVVGPHEDGSRPAVPAATQGTRTSLAPAAPPAVAGDAVSITRDEQQARDVAPADVAPEPTATAARVASDAPAAGKAKVKNKAPAPKEHLTDQDKRALDQVLERAAEQKAH
jgi:hypothetical protein